EPSSGKMLMNADHEIQNGAMPLSNWPVGKVIEDSMTISIPRAELPRLQLRLGFWQGDSRLPVDDPRLQDGTDRVLGPTIDIESGSPLPEYRVKKTAHPPTL